LFSLKESIHENKGWIGDSGWRLKDLESKRAKPEERIRALKLIRERSNPQYNIIKHLP
jgi:hypothetical protein